MVSLVYRSSRGITGIEVAEVPLVSQVTGIMASLHGIEVAGIEVSLV